MKSIKGDLVTRAKQGHYDVIVHGCNAFIKMGSGIAKEIKREFPAAYEADVATKKGDINKLGTYSKADISIGLDNLVTVINAYTQYRYGSGNHADYKAIAKVFRNLKNDFGNKNLRFGIPKIGAGRAGGDWDLISKIIDTELYDENVELVIYEKN